MSALSLLADMMNRGVFLWVDARNLRWRARQGVVSEADVAQLRAHKSEILGLLADQAPLKLDGTAEILQRRWANLSDKGGARLESEASSDPDAAGVIGAIRQGPSGEPCAWLLYSRGFDRELWVVRDHQALEVIRGEVSGRPVIFMDDLEALRTLDAAAMRAVLDAKAVMGPGTRLVANDAAEEVADGGEVPLAPLPNEGATSHERIADQETLRRRA